jgi:hypothetical protein
VAADTPDPLEGFETWLLHRVAQAVEAGEVPADLLTELQAELVAARERPEEEAAVQNLAALAEIPEEEAAKALAAIEARARVRRQLLEAPGWK